VEKSKEDVDAMRHARHPNAPRAAAFVDVNPVLNFMRSLPGIKIVSLNQVDGEPMTIDVSETGEFGYEPGHLLMFLAKVAHAIGTAGGIVIRQFSDEKTPDGIPVKHIYGIALGSGRWRGLRAEEVEQAFSHDAVTGKPITVEPGLRFRDAVL
jgi:hypothetical protein